MGKLEKSSVAKHMWKEHHPIIWEETLVVDQAMRPKELLLKEVLHIQMTPTKEHFNCDGGLELPDCWMATLRRLKGKLTSVNP